MTITSNDPLAIERAQEIDRLRVDLDREQKKRSALELALIHLREAVSLPRDFSQRDSQIETAWVEAGEALYGPMGEWVRRSDVAPIVEALLDLTNIAAPYCADRPKVIVALAAIKTLGITPTNK
jgi:hypothetical protein